MIEELVDTGAFDNTLWLVENDIEGATPPVQCLRGKERR
jgi:hypothetical protein